MHLPRNAIFLSAFILLATLLVACDSDSESDSEGGGSGETFGFGLGAVTVASDGLADRVSAMQFAPDGRIFYAEQLEGTIRIINADGTPAADPFAQIAVADWAAQDWGLTGLALDPDFATNGYVYAFYTEPITAGDVNASPVVNPTGRPTIVRFTDQGGVGAEQAVISADFPETNPAKAGFNANGEIAFGADGKLYASVGDYDLGGEDPAVITDLSTPIGKVLRMNPDGSAPDDNPFVGDPAADPRVYAFGFREPFPLTFAADGTLYGTDNTTVSCEELNVLQPGLEYGWPNMGAFPFPDCSVGPGQQPIYNMARDGMSPGDFVSFVEVSGLSQLVGSTYSQLGDSLMVCESRKSPDASGQPTQGVLKRMTLNGPTTVESYEQVSSNCFGDVRTNAGQVYYATQTAIRKLVEAAEGEDEPPPSDKGNGDEGDGGEDAPETVPVPVP
jgi:glucose/arabinose dehydrogenase